MKCSLGISNFLEEISSLSHSIVFLYFFASRLYIVTLLFNFYAEYIMWNARLEEAQAGIKIVGIWNISNLRHADDTSLITESEEELKSLFMKVKEESEKVDRKSVV